jgi:hypothetical protein
MRIVEIDGCIYVVVVGVVFSFLLIFPVMKAFAFSMRLGLLGSVVCPPYFSLWTLPPPPRYVSLVAIHANCDCNCN